MDSQLLCVSAFKIDWAPDSSQTIRLSSKSFKLNKGKRVSPSLEGCGILGMVALRNHVARHVDVWPTVKGKPTYRKKQIQFHIFPCPGAQLPLFLLLYIRCHSAVPVYSLFSELVQVMFLLFESKSINQCNIFNI